MRLIDADAVKRMLCGYCSNTLCDGDCEETDALDALPTIDPVKHGRWREFLLPRESMIFERSSAECSCCGLIVPWYFAKLSDYCIHCGAKMERGEE